MYMCIHKYIDIHSLLIALAALRLRISGSIPTYLRSGRQLHPVAIFFYGHRGHCLRHEVLFLGACLDPGAPVMFVTEYMPRGGLVQPNKLVVMDVHHKYSILELIRTYYESYI